MLHLKHAWLFEKVSIVLKQLADGGEVFNAESKRKWRVCFSVGSFVFKGLKV